MSRDVMCHRVSPPPHPTIPCGLCHPPRRRRCCSCGRSLAPAAAATGTGPGDSHTCPSACHTWPSTCHTRPQTCHMRVARVPPRPHGPIDGPGPHVLKAALGLPRPLRVSPVCHRMSLHASQACHTRVTRVPYLVEAVDALKLCLLEAVLTDPELGLCRALRVCVPMCPHMSPVCHTHATHVSHACSLPGGGGRCARTSCT